MNWGNMVKSMPSEMTELRFQVDSNVVVLLDGSSGVESDGSYVHTGCSGCRVAGGRRLPFASVSAVVSLKDWKTSGRDLDGVRNKDREQSCYLKLPAVDAIDDTQYVWDDSAKAVKMVDISTEGSTPDSRQYVQNSAMSIESLKKKVTRSVVGVRNAFFPNPSDVTPGMWQWWSRTRPCQMPDKLAHKIFIVPK